MQSPLRWIVRPVLSKVYSMEKVKENAELAKKTIVQLKSELTEINSIYNNIKAQQLREENEKLLQAVEEAKNRLIKLEIKNGTPQIPLPNSSNKNTSNENTQKLQTVKVEQFDRSEKITDKAERITDKSSEKNIDKVKQEKKPKEKAPAAPELPVDVGRLDLRIAKVEEVQRHPDADSLYVLKINCGEEKVRTVCSGLVKHVPIEELRDRMVLLLCNLKPVKMRGITSEAMVMCASSPEKVEVLTPPLTSSAGEAVFCKGYERQPDPVMNPKKKIFETVAPDLHTNESLEACYKGEPFYVPEKGHIVAKTLKNTPVK